MIVTIDGPVASGKSTVARLLAQHLGMFYLYTGMLYRSVAFVLAEEKGEAFILGQPNLAASDVAFIGDIEYFYIDHDPIIFYKDRDITELLSDPRLDQLASIVSSYAVVRDALLGIQRLVGQQYDIVADGRDCGTVVFPEAECKFFLTASLDERAKRVFNDPKRKQAYSSILEAREQIAQRDKRDEERAVAPLKIPHDAYVIDNSHTSIDQTIDIMMHKIEECQEPVKRFA